MITTANSTARVKILALISLIIVLIMVYPRSAQTGSTIRIQSWNLRYDSMPNAITVNETIAALNKTVPIDTQTKYYSDDTEQPWSTRRIGIKNEVLFNKVDLFTVNEGLHRQVEDLKELLDMPYIGVGRDDGAQAGEYQAIFFNPESVKLLSNDTFWLSDKPFEPSKYPGAGSYRSCSVGYFQTKKEGTKFVVINAHLDDQSEDQRRLGAALIKHRAAYEQETKKVPVFLVGDFNSQVSGETSGAYKITTGRLEFPTNRLNSTFVARYNHSSSGFEFLDLIEATPVENRLGNLATFTGFKNNVDSFSRIDFQFGSNTGNWEAVRYKVGENWYDDSYYLSDHRPVISDVVLN
ncbi:hypothetical protein KL907_003821 [Ogataea polymorpha]|nr:hypothetical protein KL936_004161 [Ogataea polymorpha]KAG7903794.1 hypothetical protein KL907_003821 [Ogataea polymorpha]